MSRSKTLQKVNCRRQAAADMQCVATAIAGLGTIGRNDGQIGAANWRTSELLNVIRADTVLIRAPTVPPGAS